MIKLVNLHDDEWVFDDSLVDLSAHEEQDEAREYWENGEIEVAENILKSIIERNNYHIDAYHHLSMLYEECSMDFEAYLCCREASRIGLTAIPAIFSWKESGLNWHHLDNRPFLRTYHNLGLWLQRRGENEESLNVFTRILAVSPEDNLGVRYLLPKLWLKKGDVLSLIRHCKKYKEDYSPDLMYLHPLALALSGETQKAKQLLIKAKSEFPLVFKELKKKRHTKSKSASSSHVTVGGADEAYLYWEQFGEYWLNSELALKVLLSI